MIDPVPQLARPERRLAVGRHLGRQGLPAQAHEIAARTRGRGRRREVLGMEGAAHGRLDRAPIVSGQAQGATGG